MMKINPLFLLSLFLCCAVFAEEADQSSGWWSFTPAGTIKVPTVGSGSNPAHPIDAFIRSRLAKEGMDPSKPASPGVLVRRLHFDLLGLPPAPGVVEEFARDPSPAAYRELVDSLLASPHYGERWARHWLDVARYGESNGFEYNEARRNAWPYRDWVINALNEGMPFDQFVTEQIAGDLLPDATLSQKKWRVALFPGRRRRTDAPTSNVNTPIPKSTK